MNNALHFKYSSKINGMITLIGPITHRFSAFRYSVVVSYLLLFIFVRSFSFGLLTSLHATQRQCFHDICLFEFDFFENGLCLLVMEWRNAHGLCLVSERNMEFSVSFFWLESSRIIFGEYFLSTTIHQSYLKKAVQ